jgi:hypothetical protein
MNKQSYSKRQDESGCFKRLYVVKEINRVMQACGH